MPKFWLAVLLEREGREVLTTKTARRTKTRGLARKACSILEELDTLTIYTFSPALCLSRGIPVYSPGYDPGFLSLKQRELGSCVAVLFTTNFDSTTVRRPRQQALFHYAGWGGCVFANAQPVESEAGFGCEILSRPP